MPPKKPKLSESKSRNIAQLSTADPIAFPQNLITFDRGFHNRFAKR